MSPILAAAFPHFSDSKQAHVIYVQNLLKIIDYAPELRSEILVLVTERLVKIDVQVQVDMEDLGEEVIEGLVEAVAKPNLVHKVVEDLESEDEEEDNDSTISDELLDVEGRRMRDVKSNMEKTDIIIDILFHHYDPLFATKNLEDTQGALDVLLSHFDTIILPTYRSRHTQFLLFHFAQLAPTLIDSFAGACVNITFDKSRPAFIRQSAAAYLASFVARGKHVPAQLVQDVFDVIGHQLLGLLSEYEASCRGPDLRRYHTFYALVQALLYIFCFRWRDLRVNSDEYTDDDDDDDIAAFDERPPTWAPGVKEVFERTIYSRLNPLKVCSPPIVAEFAETARQSGLIYVVSLIEMNKRLRLSRCTGSAARGHGGAYSQPDRETALSVKNDESVHQLDAYFPFDPYRLPRGKRWIEGDYVEWQGVPEEEGQLDGGESDSDEGEDGDLEGGSEADEDEGTGTATEDSD